ncbi:MAG TPA: metallophosphoesterase [Bacteroidia bacterium]|jgi:Icc protein|nr:metallophosphoesterase [Bacteroidia bacterium]
MEKLSRQKFLQYLGLSSAALVLPGLSPGRSLIPLAASPASRAPALTATPTPLRMAHLTDIHVQSGPESETGFAAALEAVNRMSEKPDFILNGGDAIMNSALNLSREEVKTEWGLFHSILNNHNSIPLRHCVGNHDLYGWTSPSRTHAEGKQWALDEYELSKGYYAFQKENWKFIVLDSIHGRRSVPGYYAKLDDAQFDWLKTELESTPSTQYICIVTHVPILAMCTLFNEFNKQADHYRIPDNILHADAEELIALFASYPNIRTCLSGHIHRIDQVNYLGIDYFCNGAVSGSWWKGNYHQFPPSFSMMNFYENGKVERELIYYNWKNI